MNWKMDFALLYFKEKVVVKQLCRCPLRKVSSVARSRSFREKEGKVLLEGRRLICDALSAGASPQMLFFSAVERLQELPLDKLQQVKLIKVKYEDMKTWSDLVTPQGVIGPLPNLL